MKIKPDEENFDEAESQAYKCWTSTTVPSEVAELFQDTRLTNITPKTPRFFVLLAALKEFTQQAPYTLPLSSTLPDMKSNTENYVHLQKLYKTRAEEEKGVIKKLLAEPVDDDLVDSFVKNAHGLKLLKGKLWGTLNGDKEALGMLPRLPNAMLQIYSYSLCQLTQPALCPNNSPRTSPSLPWLRSILITLLQRPQQTPLQQKQRRYSPSCQKAGMMPLERCMYPYRLTRRRLTYKPSS